VPDKKEALVGNVADEDQIRRGRKKQNIREELELKDMKDLLATHFGKRILWRYLAFCKIFESSFTVDPNITSFNEGKRDVGLKMLADISEADPGAFVEMMLANKKT